MFLSSQWCVRLTNILPNWCMYHVNSAFGNMDRKLPFYICMIWPGRYICSTFYFEKNTISKFYILGYLANTVFPFSHCIQFPDYNCESVDFIFKAKSGN